MKKFKLILSCIIILSLLFSLSACGGKTEYKTDVSVSDIAAEIAALKDSVSFSEMNASYIEGAMKLDTADFAEYIVELNALGTNIDEFGIFKAKDDKNVSDVKSAVDGYLSFRLETWMNEYMPEEKPKLENAEVKVCGLYVMYAIFDDDSRAAAFEAFENYLKK